MKNYIIALLLIASASAFAEDLERLYEKAYFLETAKGQTEEALEIYRKIAATKATDKNQAAILKTLRRMQALYSGQLNGILQEKVAGFDMENGGLKNVLLTFGDPESYIFGNKTYKQGNLPENYIMTYQDGFRVCMHDGGIEEFRFEEKPLYTIGGITVGTPLDQVLKALGKPKKTVTGKQCDYEEGILYKNSKGRPNGHAYYGAKGLRLFFMDRKVCALYVTDNTILSDK